MNIKGVIEAYQEGDFETRLYMFLNYRDLRDEFEEVEQSDRKRKGNRNEQTV